MNFTAATKTYTLIRISVNIRTFTSVGYVMTFLKSRMRPSILSVLVGLLFIPVLNRAQDYRGKVQGSITDPSHAAIADVGVTLKNLGTGVAVTRKTNAEGRYIFDFVESGVYMILIEATGFKKYEQQNIKVENRGDVTVRAQSLQHRHSRPDH